MLRWFLELLDGPRPIPVLFTATEIAEEIERLEALDRFSQLQHEKQHLLAEKKRDEAIKQRNAEFKQKRQLEQKEQKRLDALQREEDEQKANEERAEEQRIQDAAKLKLQKQHELRDACLNAPKPKQSSLVPSVGDVELVCLKFDATQLQELLDVEPAELLARVKVEAERVQQAQNVTQANDDGPVDSPWTDDELSSLAKATARFPGGVKDRWQQIARQIPTRTESEIIRKSRLLAAENNLAILKQKENFRSDFDRSVSATHKTYKQKPDQNDTTTSSSSSSTKGHNTSETNTSIGNNQSQSPPSATVWTADEQKLLEEALMRFDAANADRWSLIAQHTGRSRRECLERYRFCVNAVKNK